VPSCPPCRNCYDAKTTRLAQSVISRQCCNRSLWGVKRTSTIWSGSHGFEGFDYLGDMSAPSIQGLFALCQEFVALIDRRDRPRARSR
jgi:hypothetical protein